MCEAQDEHGPSWPSSFTDGSSKDTQLRQEVGQGLGHILGKIPKDSSSDSDSSPVLFHGIDPEESGSDPALLRNDSGSDVLTRLGRDLEDLLRGHLDRKLGQISKGWIPLIVRRFWLAINYTHPKSSAHVKSLNLGSVKSRKLQVNTADTISFLDMDTQEVLAAHVTRLGVRHIWGLPLKVLRPVNLLGLEKPPPSPTQQAPLPTQLPPYLGPIR